MVDKLIENAEFGRKNKDEEEPILVAQRFLNIYRQMHIFNKERQNQFDNMLLELPPDVRILLSTLPGGSVLLEHIEELEAQKGLVSPVVVKEKEAISKNAKSLTKKNSEVESSGSDKTSSGNASVIIDSSFASTLSTSLSFALQQTERRYKEDIKILTENLTHSIMESQSAIANMMKDIVLSVQKNEPLTENVIPLTDHNNVSSSTQNNTPIKNQKTVASQDANVSLMAENNKNSSENNKKDKTDKKNNKKEILPDASVNEIPAKTTTDENISSNQSLSHQTSSQKVTTTKNNDNQNTIPVTNDPSATDNVSVVNKISQPQETSKKDIKTPQIPYEKNNKKITSFPEYENNQPQNAEVSDDHTVSNPDQPLADTIKSLLPKNENGRRKKLSELDEVTPFVSLDTPIINIDEKLATPEEMKYPTDDLPLTDDDVIKNLGLTDSELNLNTELSEIYDNEKISDVKASVAKSDSGNKSFGNELEQIRQAIQDKSVLSEKNPDNILANLSTDKNVDIDVDDYEKIIVDNHEYDDLSDIVSLDDIPDTPFSLDYVPDNTKTTENTVLLPSDETKHQPVAEDGDDWEWEYVDDNADTDSDTDNDWEWEYVDDNGNVVEDDNDDWEWEYVDDTSTTDENDNKK